MKALVLLTLLCTACGGGGGGAPDPHDTTTPPPPVTGSPGTTVSEVPEVTGTTAPTATSYDPNPTPAPALKPMDYTVDHYAYIIGGQSNGVRLLYTVAGFSSDPLTNTADLLPGADTRTTGNGTGSMPIEWFLEPANSAALFNLVSTNCTSNPYLVWYQGESNSGGNDSTGRPNYLSYNYKLITFFNQIITLCPNVSIIEISIGQQVSARAAWYQQIRQIQQSIPGVPFIDAQNYGDAYGYYYDGAHLVQASYIALWSALTTKYSLH